MNTMTDPVGRPYFGFINPVPVVRNDGGNDLLRDAATLDTDGGPAVPLPQAVFSELQHGLRQAAGVRAGGRCELGESYRRAAHQVRQRLRAQSHTVLAVTCTRHTEAGTSAALNLAMALAGNDTAVLLVDADLSGGGLQRRLRWPQRPGVIDHLVGRQHWRESLVDPGIPGLQLLAAGQGAAEAEVRLGSEATGRLVAELRQAYAGHCVVFDLPPLLDDAEALGFMPWADNALVVVEDDRTRIDDLMQVAELLMPFPLLGSILSAPTALPARDQDGHASTALGWFARWRRRHSHP